MAVDLEATTLADLCRDAAEYPEAARGVARFGWMSTVPARFGTIADPAWHAAHAFGYYFPGQSGVARAQRAPDLHSYRTRTTIAPPPGWHTCAWPGSATTRQLYCIGRPWPSSLCPSMPPRWLMVHGWIYVRRE